MISVTSPRTLCAFPSTGVISALPAYHRVAVAERLAWKLNLKDQQPCERSSMFMGEALIVDDQQSSTIRSHLNVTIVIHVSMQALIFFFFFQASHVIRAVFIRLPEPKPTVYYKTCFNHNVTEILLKPQKHEENQMNITKPISSVGSQFQR